MEKFVGIVLLLVVAGCEQVTNVQCSEGQRWQDGVCVDARSGLADSDNDGVSDDRDCAPNNPRIYPGAREICGDGVDQDCDNTDLLAGDCDTEPTRVDRDRDGYSAQEDCDDDQASTHPGAEDPCGDGKDQNCDGQDGYADHHVDAGNCGEPWVDRDGDGYPGRGGEPWEWDCNDANPDIHPNAYETCYDNIDYDCDGSDDPTDDRDGGDACGWYGWYDAALPDPDVDAGPE